MIAGITSKAHQSSGGLSVFVLWDIYLASAQEYGLGVRASIVNGRAFRANGGLLLWYAAADLFIALVNDGFSGRPVGLVHQLLLLPFTFALAASLILLLTGSHLPRSAARSMGGEQLAIALVCVCCSFEALSLGAVVYEAHHFHRFGYELHPIDEFLAGVGVAGLAWLALRHKASPAFLGVLVAYTAGLLLAIRSFPLNYLRSDMLPVILWADRRLVTGMDPYVTMHVGARVYDFPYLPGMLVCYLPAVAFHFDLRWINLVSVLCLSWLIYWVACTSRRFDAALLLGLFLLSPFLQYRHDLYLAPHWLLLTAAVVLVQRRHFTRGAAVFGLGMAVYQLSWVIFPFLILYAYRRSGWREAVKESAVALIAMLGIVGPFLASAMHRIESNTVGQWSHMPHALADPINLSYWVTFLVRPADLKWVQLAVMTAIFAYCLLRGKCGTLADTLRWMSVALAFFIALNVLVDGYFYLTLLLVLLLYTCSASGIWAPNIEDQEGSPLCGEPALYLAANPR